MDVDLSLFTEDKSFGHINGTMILPSISSPGDVFSIIHPGSEGFDELIGKILVKNILHADATPILMLSDLNVRTKSDAFRVSRFLENGFGLFANIHDEEDLRFYMDQGQSENG